MQIKSEIDSCDGFTNFLVLYLTFETFFTMKKNHEFVDGFLEIFIYIALKAGGTCALKPLLKEKF